MFINIEDDLIGEFPNCWPKFERIGNAEEGKNDHWLDKIKKIISHDPEMAFKLGSTPNFGGGIR